MNYVLFFICAQPISHGDKMRASTPYCRERGREGGGGTGASYSYYVVCRTKKEVLKNYSVSHKI